MNNSKNGDDSGWILVDNNKNKNKKNKKEVNNQHKLKSKIKRGSILDNKLSTMSYKMDDNVLKKILCNNIFLIGECHYGPKCLYAHALNEQKIEPVRDICYKMIMEDNNDLSNINLHEKNDIYRTLLQMTKICDMCIQKKCVGGYNCKYGVFDKKYQICINDLKYGDCNESDCELVHLTKKNIKPIYEKKNKIIYDSDSLIDDLFLVKRNNMTNDINKFIEDDLSISEESNEIIQTYFTSVDNPDDSDESCERSIFHYYK